MEPNKNTLPTWLDEEIRNSQTEFIGEKLPSLKLEIGKIVSFTVDFSQPFHKWTGDAGKKKVTKAVIPVNHKGEKKNFWLNIQNPLYKEICTRGKAGQNEFKVSTSGTQDATRYTLVEED